MMIIISAIVAFILSLLAKIAADAWLASYVPVLGAHIGLRFSRNPGVAFGITFAPALQWLLVTIAVVLLVSAARQARTTMQRIGFGMIIGGALGNIVDRIPDGFVTDFFQVGQFPIFNVADSCVTIGIALILIESALASQKKRNGTPTISRR
jgi:signal peptidase II